MEREHLRREVENLTVKLARELQDKREGSLLSVAADKAKQELAARKLSETEQQKRYATIGARAVWIQVFHTRVHENLRHLRNVLVDRERLDLVQQHKRIRYQSDQELFAKYIEELDAIHEKTDKMLEAYGLDSTEEDWGGPEWQKDDEADFFKFVNKQILPFNFEGVCRCRWDAALLHHRKEARERFEDVNDPENTVVIKFSVPIRMGSGETTSVLQRFVIHRYDEKERTVIVWRCSSKGEGMLRGLRANETGWGVATRANAGSGTMVRTCARTDPFHLDNADLQDPVVKQFTCKLLGWGVENSEEVTTRLPLTESVA